MTSLRYKVRLGYVVLLCISIGTSVFAVYNFSRLGDSIGRILRENYHSVLAAENMVKALERQQNAQLSMFAGEAGKALFYENRDLFLRWYQKATEDMTLPIEPVILDSLIATYRTYLLFSDSLHSLVYAEGTLATAKAYHFDMVRPITNKLKEQCFQLLEVNQNAIMAVDRSAKAIATEATFTVIATTSIAIFLIILASIHFTRRIIKPAEKLTFTVRQISQGHLNQKIDITTDDEFGQLSREINKMTERLLAYEKTNIKQLIAEKKRSEGIVASIPDPVIVTDEHNQVLLMNQAAANLLQIFGESGNGKSINDVVKDDRWAKVLGGEASKIDELSQVDSLLSITQGEKTLYFRPRPTKIVDESGRVKGVVILLQDVTRFKNLEQMKSEFMATVSHEFRTPLTSVNMAVDILLQNVLGGLNDRQRDLLTSAKQDCERLTKLVKELLDLSRLESGKYPTRIERLNLYDVVEASINPLRLPFKEKGLKLELALQPALPDFPADQRQLAWVITNLVSNALRYTEAGGKVTISAVQEEDAIQVSVTDSGRGIPREALDTIFEKFVQVKQSSDSTPGSVGLGLAIAREVIESYGGKIWVESEMGKGSTFYFTIPLERNG